jgi:hypothetical protein
MNLPWGIVIPIHLVKCTKLITSMKSDHVYYTLKIFEKFIFLEDENVPLVLGGLTKKSKFFGDVAGYLKPEVSYIYFLTTCLMVRQTHIQKGNT